MVFNSWAGVCCRARGSGGVYFATVAKEGGTGPLSNSLIGRPPATTVASFPAADAPRRRRRRGLESSDRCGGGGGGRGSGGDYANADPGAPAAAARGYANRPGRCLR